MGEYSYTFDVNLILGICSGLAQLVLCLVAAPKRRKNAWRLPTAIASVVGAGVGAAFFAWINLGTGFWTDVSGLTWDHSIGISKYGYLLYVTANAGEAKVEQPEGYSVAKAEEILSKYDTAEGANSVLATHAGAEKSPNLIMIMNESFADLSVLGELQTNQEVLPFFNSLKENTIRGYVQSSVYGGYTANSEFEFLTGCTKAFMPGNPYLQYVDDYLPTIIGNIKAQEGYDRAVAVHPYKPSGYNRNRVYPLFSFDEFLDIDDFVHPIKVRKYISDKSDYEMLEQLFEEKEEGESLCVFNVTMQNHSAYDYQGYTFENPVTIENINLQPEAEQYLSLMKMSDEALENLINYFEGVDEPVMVVFFGDHQPHLPDFFYKKLMGKLPDEMDQEDSMKRYQVPFFIWANYDIREDEIEQTSINYLSTIMMETAGMKLTAYQKFLLDMYQYVPCISANGYYDYEGGLHDWSETDNKVIDWIEKYRIVQYNYIFDKENRLEQFFSMGH